MRYDQLCTLIALYKPKTLVEIGTNAGERGLKMCEEALKHRRHVDYVGYDVFDSETDEFHTQAFNGKGFFARAGVEEKFAELGRHNTGFRFRLIEGRTDETLHNKPVRADFIFIDGDHRAEMIARDYQAVRQSKVTVFDDYYGDDSPVDRTQIGCNSVVDRIKYSQILPIFDSFKHTGAIRMAVVVRPHIFFRGKAFWFAHG